MNKLFEDLKVKQELSEFEKNTTMTMHKNGRCEIVCNKGLWSVEARNKSEATREAVSYFIKYWGSGEYANTNGREVYT